MNVYVKKTKQNKTKKQINWKADNKSTQAIFLLRRKCKSKSKQNNDTHKIIDKSASNRC